MGRQHTVRRASRHSPRRITSRTKHTSDQNLDRQRQSFKSKQRSAWLGKLTQVPALMLWLLKRYPLLIWLMALSILVGSATAAITTILNPDASVPYSAVSPVASSSPAEGNPLKELPAPTATGLTAPTHSSQSPASSPQPSQFSGHQGSAKPSASAASPQSAVGAIALSCAAGCFLLSQWLKPRPISSRRVLFERSPSTKQIQRQDGQVQDMDVPTVALTPTLDALAVPLPQRPAAPLISFDLNPAQSKLAEKPSVEVTVLPAEQSHPLDWDEPSLADSLDLRQRRPLSYWL